MQHSQFDTTVVFKVGLLLDENEARALAQLFGYGVDVFIKTFYEKLGRAYLEPYEHGIRSLAAALSDQLTPQLRVVDVGRKAIAAALATTCTVCRGENNRHYTDCTKEPKP